MKPLLLISSGVLGTVFFWAALVLWARYEADHYYRETPLAMREQHERLARELQKAPVGTIVKQTNGKFLVVHNLEKEFADPQVQKIYFSKYPGERCMLTVSLLAREAERLIAFGDPEYCEAAHTYLTCMPN